MLHSWSMRVALAAVLALAVGPLLSWARVVPPKVGFYVYLLAAPLGLASVIAGGSSILRTHRMTPGILAIALGLCCIAVILLPAVSDQRPPPINDITTDLEHGPVFVHAGTLKENQGRDLAYPAAFRPVVQKFYKNVQPIEVREAPEAVFARAVALARQQPKWTVTHVDAAGHTFEGTAETALFHFVDDFVVRVTPVASGARVDMRSKSRDGRGDFGVNAARIRDFLSKLESS